MDLTIHIYTPSSPSDSALFGYSVHISSDGSKTIVGEPYENAENHGAAYIFNSSGTIRKRNYLQVIRI